MTGSSDSIQVERKENIILTLDIWGLITDFLD